MRGNLRPKLPTSMRSSNLGRGVRRGGYSCVETKLDDNRAVFVSFDGVIRF